jgi:hypothetical protein
MTAPFRDQNEGHETIQQNPKQEMKTTFVGFEEDPRQ